MLKIAEVSQVDYEKGMLKVRIPDRDNIETNWLSMPSTPAVEYEMPQVNDLVRVSFDDGDYTNGICHGRYFNRDNMPERSGPTIFYKKLAGDMVIQYDSDSKTLEITAENIQITGDVTLAGDLTVNGTVSVEGDLSVTGNIEATGTVMDGEGNSDHHSH